MGFDITFHPVGLNELRRWLFDVVNDPSLADRRARDISPDEERQAKVLHLYSQFPAWRSDRQITFAGSFGFSAAIIAGYLHPYWYARGQCLSFLAEGSAPEIKEFVTPLPRLAQDAFAELEDESGGLIRANYTGSGFVRPEHIPELQRLMQDLASAACETQGCAIGGVFNADGFDALQRALRYARERRLGLVEASDVVVPFANTCYTDYENLRAKFLGRLDA